MNTKQPSTPVLIIYFLINVALILLATPLISKVVYDNYSYNVAHKLITSWAFWGITDSVLIALILNLSIILLVVFRPKDLKSETLSELK